MKVQKKILKTCAVLTAAAMAASPVTVKAVEAIPAEAVNRIAEKDISYKILSDDYVGPEETGPGVLKVLFDGSDFFDEYYSWEFGRTVPEGYKTVSTVVECRWYENDGDGWGTYSDDSHFSWTVSAENSRSWTRVDDEYRDVFDFTVDCGGVTYPECWAAVQEIDMCTYKVEMAVPQQYDEAMTFTVYGNKTENGQLIRNEESYITGYLQGSNGSYTQTPAADPKPTQPVTDTPAATQQPAQPTVDTPAADSHPVVTDRQGTTYVTKPGDSLMKIAKELYGDKELWTAIYEQNKNLIKNPNVIYANMQLQLP